MIAIERVIHQIPKLLIVPLFGRGHRNTGVHTSVTLCGRNSFKFNTKKRILFEFCRLVSHHIKFIMLRHHFE